MHGQEGAAISMTERSRGVMTVATGPVRLVRAALYGIAGPTARRWWNNPLLRHARRSKSLPLGLLRVIVPWLGVLLALGAGVAWLLAEQFIEAARVAGAALVGLSLGMALLPVAAAAPVAAGLAARQADIAWHDPDLVADTGTDVFVWGLALTALWRLRWLVVIGLVFSPALAVSLLRLDVVSFTAWHDSAIALSGATTASRAAWLLPDGGIPFFRLVLRALTGAMLPWAGLPLMAALGVAIGVRVPDPALAPLVAIPASFVLGAAVVLGWHYLTLMPYLHGPGEVIRAALVGLLLFVVWRAADGVNHLSARRLEPEEG